MSESSNRASGSNPIAAAVDAVAPEIHSAVLRRWNEDGALRTLALRCVGQMPAGQCAEDPVGAGRLARLAAIALVAALGCDTASRRSDHRRPELPETVAGLAETLDRRLAIAGPTITSATPSDDPLLALALHAIPEPALRRLCRDAGGWNMGQEPADATGPLWEAVTPAAARRSSGQFYSAVDPIDLTLAFCLRRPGPVLDPSCGTGAFLVRAIQRLRALPPEITAVDPGGLMHGVDLDASALRLAGYNLAARGGQGARLHHADFFALTPAELPAMAAIVGNPPYTRQEALAGRTDGGKAVAWNAVQADWDSRVSGRAGLHTPFLLHAAAFLRPGGRLGMLTSNSWLNAGYGRELRRFLLAHCRIIAIVAPSAERWFGAAVHPLLLVAEREDDPAVRLAHRARFVRLKRSIAELVGDVRAPDRWAALDHLVGHMEGTSGRSEDSDMHVLAVRQTELERGIAASPDGQRSGRCPSGINGYLWPVVSCEITDAPPSGSTVLASEKWAIYLRAPELYFDLLRRAGDRFCRLGEIATVRRGLTTGANGFFYVRDESNKLDDAALAALGLRREQLANLRAVAAGDGSLHIVEARYLQRIVTSPREVVGLAVDPARLPYHAVILPGDRSALTGTRACDYVHWGERASSAGQVAPASRPTCAARQNWWSLPVCPAGPLLWCKTHFTRHLAPLNPGLALADCNLYHITPKAGVDTTMLAAVLNSTLVAMLKELHGRANLGEGALKTEVSDVVALPVPDPRRLGAAAGPLLGSFRDLGRRKTGAMPDELERGDRRALDEALLGALGYADPAAAMEALYVAMAGLLRERVGG